MNQKETSQYSLIIIYYVFPLIPGYLTAIYSVILIDDWLEFVNAYFNVDFLANSKASGKLQSQFCLIAPKI